MTTYIGTPTSRVDGRAKVTGAAKYAAEFNVPGLAHGSVVTSTIAKGRIVRIDASEALRVDGVIDVLTHQNRPRMADTDSAYKDEVAPEGSPFRPLYDDKIHVQRPADRAGRGRESRRSRASQRRWSAWNTTKKRTSRTCTASVMRRSRLRQAGEDMFAPPKPRGTAEKAFAAADVRHQAEYYVPIEHHNPMELFASTVIWEGDGKLTVYDKTQGVQNVQRYLCGVFDMKPDDVRVMSPFMGGGFGSGLRPQYQVVLAVLAARALKRSVRVVLTRQQMYGLGYRPAMIQRIELGANGGRNARRDHARSDHGDVAIRGLPSARDRLVRPALQVRQREVRAQARAARSCDVVRHARSKRRDRRLCARMRDGRACGRAQARSARASPAVLFGSRPERGQAVQQQEACANATARARKRSAGTSATPSRARCATATSWWAGAWRPASGKRCRCRSRCASCSTANGHAEVSCATSDIGTGTYTIMAQVAADMLGLPLDNVTIKLGDSTLPQSPVEGGSWIAASVSNGIATTSDAVRKELLRLAKQMPNSPLADAAAGRRRACGRQAREQAGCFARGVDRRCDAAWRRGSHRAGEIHQLPR